MKERTLNEYRQTKEYKLDRLEKAHKLNDAAKAKLHEFKDVEFDDLETPKEIKEITLKQQIEEIADIVVPTINDMIFNEIIEVMDNYDELNWGYFVQDDAPTALLDACYDHKQQIHSKIFQLVLQKLK